MTLPFAHPDIAAAFDAVADPLARGGMARLRALILEAAADLPQIGRLEEALRWGQPAYLTPDTMAATTLRLGVPKVARIALFEHCRSSLISDFTAAFPAWDRVEGSCAVLFDAPAQIDSNRHG
ncbi:MAG: hypothetical protein ACI8R4_001422 [Paracoccaceae bacterium]|jgi:hypothetical protein